MTKPIYAILPEMRCKNSVILGIGKLLLRIDYQILEKNEFQLLIILGILVENLEQNARSGKIT
jgi:hypothetical protein